MLSGNEEFSRQTAGWAGGWKAMQRTTHAQRTEVLEIGGSSKGVCKVCGRMNLEKRIRGGWKCKQNLTA